MGVLLYTATALRLTAFQVASSTLGRSRVIQTPSPSSDREVDGPDDEPCARCGSLYEIKSNY